MASPRETWRSLSRSSKVFAVAIPLVASATFAGAVLIASTPAPALITAASPGPTATPPALSPTSGPNLTPGASLEPSPSPSPSVDPLTGQDGRLTVLLLGSDYRRTHTGNRTDTIMVVSVEPTTGDVAAASIPRDTGRFPLPEGGFFSERVNALYQHYATEFGRAEAGERMKAAVGAALGLEVDRYVFIGFGGLRELVDAVGGVDVILPRAVSDPFYWVNNHTQGVYFPKGLNHLGGDRALIFARTRQGDNDFERARRQQLLVAAAVVAVRERGLERLPALIALAEKYIRTDLPLLDAPRIFGIVAAADLAGADGVVFGPRTYAEGIGGSTSFVLKLDVIRAWISRHAPPVPGSPAAPLPSPSGSPGASPSPSP